METILLWLYLLIGFCIGAKFIVRYSKKSSHVDVPMLCLTGALLIYFWPVYLIYYYYNTESY